MHKPKCPNCNVELILIGKEEAKCPNCEMVFYKSNPNIKFNIIKMPFDTIPKNVLNMLQNFQQPNEIEENPNNLQLNKDKLTIEIVDSFIETMNRSLKDKWNKIEDISKDRAKVVWKTVILDILENYDILEKNESKKFEYKMKKKNKKRRKKR